MFNLIAKTKDGKEVVIKDVVSFESQESEAQNAFHIKKGDAYYTITSEGGVLRTISMCSAIDKTRGKFGNACKDEKYMKRRAREQHLLNSLNNFAEVVNEGWKQYDGHNGHEIKWVITYNINCEEWTTNSRTFLICPGVPFFKTKKLAQRAIDDIIILPHAENNNCEAIDGGY